jgi:hypothetical protein
MLDTQTDELDVYDKAVSTATDKMGCVYVRRSGEDGARGEVVIHSAGGDGEGAHACVIVLDVWSESAMQGPIDIHVCVCETMCASGI